jgi:beta-glucosidase-like glycosyl hydrolase/aryl-phospho-beta-D-glucosidase BglC (GH1 family)
MKKAKVLSFVLAIALIMQLFAFTLLPAPTEVNAAITSADFLKTDGNVLRNQSGTGDIVTLRGTNFGGWLVQEGWMSPNGYGALGRTGWTATASSTAANESAANALDGDINTRWSTGTAQVNGQWFKLDMGSQQTFDQISIDAGPYTGDYPAGYLIQVSADGTNWTDVASGQGTSQELLITFGVQTARYILIYQTGSKANDWSIAELNVHMGDDYSVRKALYNRFGVAAADSLIDGYQNAWIQESDIDNVKNMGMNVIRVPFGWLELVDENGNWKAGAWTQLDWVVAEAAERDMYVILDFHAAPGGASPWASSGQAGPNPNRLWTNTSYQDLAVQIWQGVATHFAGNPAVAGYHLINEPVLGFPESDAQRQQKNDFLNRIYNAVRAIDPDHIIIMGSLGDLNATAGPSVYGWTNVMYTAHPYRMDEPKNWYAQNSLVEDKLRMVANTQKDWKVPVLMGEYSLYFFEDVWAKWMSGMNDMNVSWTNWSYKVRGTQSESGGGNWGFYNTNTNPVPDINKDSSTTISSKWSKFTTANFQTNTNLINLVSKYTNGSMEAARFPIPENGWIATASSTESGGSAANALDNDFNTRWSTGAYQASGQWFQVDMGSAKTFDRISIQTTDNDKGDFPVGYQVQVSNDGTTWTTVRSGAGFGFKMVILLPTQTARYIKLVQTGSSTTNWWSIAEFDVYRTQPVTLSQTGLPYQDSSLSVDQRVADLMSRMTTNEKIGQLLQVERYTSPDDVRKYGIGSVLSGGGSAPAPNTPRAWADMVDVYQNAAMSTRLQIPILYGVDAVHGHNNVYGATIFPHNIGLGATRDADLVKRIGSATAKEVRATGINWDFSPCLCAPQDDRWGRGYEGFSESPGLVGEMGAAYTEGMQGLPTDSSFLKGSKIVATTKHWIGDGNTVNGDDQGDAPMSDQDFEPFIKPYIDAIDRGARSVMIHLGTNNGAPFHSHYHLITEVLKGDIGFSGIVISDWNGANRLDPDYATALKLAINAGIDMFMEPDNWKSKDFVGAMNYLLSSGQVTQARIDDAVRRILRVKFEAGLFEAPYTDRSLLASFGGAEHRAIAREAVRKSATLLKNEGHILPLSKTAKIFVAGNQANDIGYQSGGWTISWQGSPGYVTPGTTILEGIQQAVSNSANVTYSKTGIGAAGHDVAVVVIGESPYAEMFGDVGTGQPRANLDLSSGWPEADQDVLDQVKASGVPTIVIMQSGRPMNIASRLPDWKAFIAAWLPGSEGNGIADVLFGDYDFTAKLPLTWPSSFDGNAIKVNAGDANYYPLFPFGYGLNTTASHTKEVPGIIQAENFNAASGVQSEATADINGGLNIGWIDAGDWMDYRVNVPAAGTYSVRLRVASPTGATGAIQLKENALTLSTYDVPNTGGWQTWTTISQDVTLSAGVQTLRVSAVAGGWNLNFLEFVPLNATASGNLLSNAGLETGDASGWTTWNNGTSGLGVDTDNPYNGTYKMTYWAGVNYQQLTSQTKTVPNGTYRFSAWVRSSGGQRSLHLYAKNHGGVEKIAEIASNATGSWTKYTIDNIKVTTGQVEVGVWADAFAGNWTAFDNFVLEPANELSNAGFESGNTSGWSETHIGALAQKADIDNPFVGSYQLKHYDAAIYQQTTSQLKSVPNGTYNFSVWVRSGGGQNALKLFAKNYGGVEMNTAIGSSAIGSWTRYTISNIQVTNGQIEVGVVSDANAGNWAVFDNFELIKQ